MGWGQFKPILTEATIEALKPIQDKYQTIVSDKSYLNSVLREGAEKAEAVASNTVSRVKKALGFLEK